MHSNKFKKQNRFGFPLLVSANFYGLMKFLSDITLNKLSVSALLSFHCFHEKKANKGLLNRSLSNGKRGSVSHISIISVNYSVIFQVYKSEKFTWFFRIIYFIHLDTLYYTPFWFNIEFSQQTKKSVKVISKWQLFYWILWNKICLYECYTMFL